MDYEEDSTRIPKGPPKAHAMLEFKEIDEEGSNIDFAVSIPLHNDQDDTKDGFDDAFTRPRPKVGQREAEAFIVGTVLKFGERSANIWFGWGQATHSCKNQTDSTSSKTRSKSRFMGSFVVATPKRTYKGAFDDSNSVSKLIGTESVHNDLVTINMASRLSEKLQMAIFCSCNLDDGRPDTALGGETEMFLLQSRAAAIVEREIARLLIPGTGKGQS